MDIDDIDLAELAADLRDRVPPGEPKGYLRGKATMRDMVRYHLNCSELEAEELVDTLELRGYLQFHGDPAERAQANATWDINPGAEI
jgi:hypothetical protein